MIQRMLAIWSLVRRNGAVECVSWSSPILICLVGQDCDIWEMLEYTQSSVGIKK